MITSGSFFFEYLFVCHSIRKFWSKTKLWIVSKTVKLAILWKIIVNPSMCLLEKPLKHAVFLWTKTYMTIHLCIKYTCIEITFQHFWTIAWSYGLRKMHTSIYLEENFVNYLDDLSYRVAHSQRRLEPGRESLRGFL